MFDADYYLHANPDVAAAAADPWTHFVDHGIFEGRRPGSPHLSRADRALILETGIFDAKFYLESNPDVAAAGVNPLDHFLRHGSRENRSPGPGFDAQWYKRIYMRDDAGNAILHYLRFGKDLGWRPRLPPEILAATHALIADLNGIDPAFDSDPWIREPQLLDSATGEPAGPIWGAFRDLFNTLPVVPDFFIFAPWLTRGGSDRIVALIARMAEQRGLGSKLVVFLTESKEETTRSWLPSSIHVVNFAARWPELTLAQRCDLINLLITGFRPGKVLNINSISCWEAYRAFGARLAANADLYSFVFGRDFSEDGFPCTFIDTHVRESLPMLRRLYSDNLAAIEYVRNAYGVPPSLEDRLRVLRTPAIAPAILPTPSARPQGISLRVFWTGRFSREKNIPLLASIIRHCPASMRFDIWGTGPKQAEIERLVADDHRVRYRGTYDDLDELPLSEYDAFLFTSLHEGRPNVLIEQACIGFPIVASQVGGVSEILDHRAWLIDTPNSAKAYVAALEAIAADLEGARTRARELARDLCARDTPEAYFNQLSAPGDFLGSPDAA